MSNSNVVLCHNSKFDLRVALEHLGVPIPHYTLIVDTMIMAYLIDPREASLGLKELAEKYCGIKPDEQKDLHDWIRKNVSTAKNAGAYIYKAPGDLVGKYAEADTDMTYELYQYCTVMFDLHARLRTSDGQNIHSAFEREMKLLPIVIGMEQRGVHLAPNIQGEFNKWQKELDLLELQLSAYGNGAKPGSKAMFNAFISKGLIDKSKITYTEKGNPQYGQDYIENLISDSNLLNVIKRRSKLQKLLGTYLKHFAESAEKYNCKYYPYYNQTRTADDYGTRTGRFSSNIQQLPKIALLEDKSDTAEMADLPNPRKLIVAPPGEVLIKRDFSSQELRVCAHFAEGAALQAYVDNPRMDIHTFVKDLIFDKTGIRMERGYVKCISFLKLYGGGPSKLAFQLRISVEEARDFFTAYDAALPDFKELMKNVEALSRSGKKIFTWGGRGYDVEPSKIIHGRKQEYYYKLGNVLIQGSSADMTKEAMIRYESHPDRKGYIYMQVHDEIVVAVDERYAESEMKVLKWAMDEIPGWDVPLCSDGFKGYNLYDMVAVQDES
jgi:DNA polymerase-1